MADITVERCPETGICSIVKNGGGKVDLLPDETEQLLRVRNNPARIRELLVDADATFAQSLSDDEVTWIGASLRS